MPRPPRQEVARKPTLGPPVTNDPRFASVHSDPRFSLPRRKDAKIRIDKRFKRMLVDEDFFHTTKVDRYGRRLATDTGKQEIKRYYQLGDSEEESLDKEESEKQLNYDPARGEGIIDTSDESGTDDGTDVEEEKKEVELEVRAGLVGEVIPTGDVYRRIAVVNLDWDNVHAVDLMVTLSSFKPANGKVLSVRIYPSEFGKSRLKREDMGGPPREIFTSKESEEESEEEVTEKTLIKADDGEEFDSSKLRNYQLERLRYYYAVIECDSENTAKHIYDECDGTEYEASANFLDLRFIPDNVEFEDPPKDECLRIPINYKPNEFVTDALQHSKVKLTWDQDDPARKNKTKKAFSQKEIEEMDLKEYLASSDSEEEDAEELKKKYRTLLNVGGKIGGKEKEVTGDMEITFTSGLMGDLGDKGQVPPHEETTIEKYVRKEKERMKSRKEAYLAKKDSLHTNGTARQDRDGSQEDLGFDDLFFQDQAAVKQEKKRQGKEDRKKEEVEKATQRAELELLMVEDEDEEMLKLKHFNIKEVIKAEKEKKFKKRKRSKNAADAEGVQEGFEVDVNDPRFAALYEEHDFAIDPTNSKFKQTSTMMKLMEEKRNRSKNNMYNKGEQVGRKKLKAAPRSSEQLIQSLKRKSKSGK